MSIDSSSGFITSLLAKNGFSIGIRGATAGRITDRNGNYISPTVNGSETDWTDSVGRLALKVITGTSSIQYKFLDYTGAYQTTTLNLESLNVKTNFGCSGVIEYSGTASVPQSLVLPNNQQYQFKYESYVSNGTTYYTGRLQRVTLPTGGYYEYDYTGANDGISCADGTTLSMNRTVSDGTNSATWNYVRNTSNLTTTITTPKLADTPNAFDTVVTFNSSGQEVKRQIYPNSPSSGTPLRTINTTWATNGTPATITTILEDGTTQSQVNTYFSSTGLLSQQCDYDFGSGSPGNLIRCTNFNYNSSSNYTSRNILDLVTSKWIFGAPGPIQYRQDITYDGVAPTNCPTSVPQHDDTSFPCSFNYRGNPTSVTTYLSPATPSGGITKNFTYDWFGNLLTAQLNCCQNKTWSYSAATQYSQPDSVTSGSSPTLTTSATYYTSTGQIKTFTDENGLVTNFSYDTLRRPTNVSQTNGGSVSYSYNDTNFTATTTATVDSTKSVQQITAVDGLGRPILSTTEDAGSNVYSKVSANYDLAGRAYQSSNPFTGSAPSYLTTTQFDVLGRPISVTLPDNSATTYSYATNTAIVTDPTGKKRESVVDGAGRLSSFYEPDPTNNNSLTLQTSYSYSVVDELTQVSQGSQTRSYVYDALGRLTSATTPEGGMVCFGTVSSGTCNANGYDLFNNLLTRTDARGVVTSYGYDGLNRLNNISYNVGTTGVPATSSVTLTYGTNAAQFNNGRLITMTDGVGSENYTYNNFGQLTQLQKVIGTNTYTIGYAYNLANELTQITYPSGRVVEQSVDPIGRLCEIAPSTTGCGTAASPYATGYGYNVAGEVTGFKYGNGVFASMGFTPDRLQLSCLDYSTTNRNGNCAHDSTTKFGLTYSYGSVGSNNGQISSISDYVQPGRSITYTYDSLFRMTNASTTGSTAYPAWGLSETNDRYGNRTAQSISSGCVSPMTCPTNSVSVDATKNRINTSGYGYDPSGNMTNDGTNTISYDGEGRAVTATNGGGSGTYTYDGNGLRVKKVSGSTATVYIFSSAKVIAEYVNGAAPSAPTREYVYAGGALLARIDSSGTKYYHQDHLSNRMVTGTDGVVAAEMGHFPFGESWYNASNDKLLFTTYERDAESGNDYAMARYHISRLGRLSSPDPLPGSTGNPQSLNRYSYSINDPANVTDPSGALPNCNTAQANPKATSQQASGHGPSDTDSSDAGTDAGDADANTTMQSGCPGSRTNPYQSEFGGTFFDGGFFADDSGQLPDGGFPIAGGAISIWTDLGAFFISVKPGNFGLGETGYQGEAEIYGLLLFGGNLPPLPDVPTGPDGSSDDSLVSHLGSQTVLKKPCQGLEAQNPAQFNFVVSNFSAASAIAALAGTTPANILGLASVESANGTSNLASNYNNYFGLTFPFPGTGAPYNSPNGYSYSTFGTGGQGILASGMSFMASRQGVKVAGAGSPAAFAADLTSQPYAFNSEQPSRVSTYINAINSVQADINCAFGPQ